jgi:ribonuclease HII
MGKPDFSYESDGLAQGHVVCGVDEAGRGPWAGPVVAAAVILDAARIPSGLNDSKKLTAEKRDVLFDAIMATGCAGVGVVSEQTIDEINILQATYLAMQKAVRCLLPAPTLALVDGNRAPDFSIRVRTIIKGDGLSLSIAAASIIAKVTRDRIMEEVDKAYPVYGFAKHKGYGTHAHAAALAQHGPCPVHRKSFNPIKVYGASLTMS